MPQTAYPLCLQYNFERDSSQALNGSGQVVTAPEPVGGEPERFVTIPGVEGLSGSTAPGAPSKSRGVGDGGGPYLVYPTNKSTQDSVAKCRNPILIKGCCLDHGNKRYRLIPCKRRDCESCGPVGRWRIAQRIAYGVRLIGQSGGRCAWLVGTFSTREAENPSFKKKARKKVASFIRSLRKETGKNLQYSLTWELTPGRHRLHVNIIIGPWVFIPHKRLRELWGARISVEWVKDAMTMGAEASKLYSVEGLSGYLSKLDQAVPQEWGRRVSFSKGWPKLPKQGPPTIGRVQWGYPEGEERITYWADMNEGFLVEVEPGEWAYREESCFCFVREIESLDGKWRGG